MGRGWPVLLALALVALPASAHKLVLRTHVDGDAIAGEVRAIPGGVVAGAVVRAQSLDGRALGETRTDADGAFRLPVTERTDHVVTADTADGHRATATVSAEDLPVAADGGTGGDVAPEAEEAAESAPAQAETMPADAAGDASADLRALVIEVRQLRDEIYGLESALRFRDILGSVGIIAGVMGLIALWKSQAWKGGRS